MPNDQQERAHVLHCLECAMEDDREAPGWRAYLLELEVLLYCPSCASHEFGPLHSATG